MNKKNYLKQVIDEIVKYFKEKNKYNALFIDGKEIGKIKNIKFGWDIGNGKDETIITEYKNNFNKLIEIKHDLQSVNDAFANSFQKEFIKGKTSIEGNCELHYESWDEFLKLNEEAKKDLIEDINVKYMDAFNEKYFFAGLHYSASMNLKRFGPDFETAGYVFNCGGI